MPLFSKCCQAPVSTQEPKMCPACNQRAYETTTKPPLWYTGDTTHLTEMQRSVGVYKRLTDPKWFTGVHKQRYDARKQHHYNVVERKPIPHGTIVMDPWLPTSHFPDHNIVVTQGQERGRSKGSGRRSPSATTPRARSSGRSGSPDRYIDQVRVDTLEAPDHRRADKVMQRIHGAPPQSWPDPPREVHLSLVPSKTHQAEEVFHLAGLPTSNVALYQDEIRHEIKVAYLRGDVALASKIEDAFLILQNQDILSRHTPTLPRQGMFSDPTAVAYLPEAADAAHNVPVGIIGTGGTSMTKCNACSTLLKPTDKFCTSCGSRRPLPRAVCRGCQCALNTGDRFCPECGMNVTGIAPNSGGVLALTQPPSPPSESIDRSRAGSPRSNTRYAFM